jgi:hypothetical protein
VILPDTVSLPASVSSFPGPFETTRPSLLAAGHCLLRSDRCPQDGQGSPRLGPSPSHRLKSGIAGAGVCSNGTSFASGSLESLELVGPISAFGLDFVKHSRRRITMARCLDRRRHDRKSTGGGDRVAGHEQGRARSRLPHGYPQVVIVLWRVRVVRAGAIGLVELDRPAHSDPDAVFLCGLDRFRVAPCKRVGADAAVGEAGAFGLVDFASFGIARLALAGIALSFAVRSSRGAFCFETRPLETAVALCTACGVVCDARSRSLTFERHVSGAGDRCAQSDEQEQEVLHVGCFLV